MKAYYVIGGIWQNFYVGTDKWSTNIQEAFRFGKKKKCRKELKKIIKHNPLQGDMYRIVRVYGH